MSDQDLNDTSMQDEADGGLKQARADSIDAAEPDAAGEDAAAEDAAEDASETGDADDADPVEAPPPPVDLAAKHVNDDWSLEELDAEMERLGGTTDARWARFQTECIDPMNAAKAEREAAIVEQDRLVAEAVEAHEAGRRVYLQDNDRLIVLAEKANTLRLIAAEAGAEAIAIAR